ncbi:MAG: exopolyphosphatase [Actinobacteria bacterium]|nr:exopolyphosphatase [Actinomycetota bacterium]
MRVGAIDCGTNSIRLLIADVDPASGALRDVVRRMEVVRLGYGVDRTGRIDPERMAAAVAMARQYAAQCREHAVAAVRFVATSASRDAENAAEFVAGVEEAFASAGFGVSPEVISGAEEAELSFLGATGDLRAAGIPGPYLVVDIGGGSTEFVRGEAHVEAALSTDVGCVRLTERHLHSDPPADAEIAAARADVEAAIDAASAVVPFAGVQALVGLAGTVTTVTAHALGLPEYLADRIHLTALPGNEIRAAGGDLLTMTRAERAALPFMHPGRVDVIGGGALVWAAIVERVQAVAGDVPVVTSEHDILDGIALSAAGGSH